MRALLDVILVVIASQVLSLTRHDNDSAVFVLMLAYHIGFWTWKGTTVGGIICQLRVVRVDGGPLRFADALVRGLSSIFSLAVLGLAIVSYAAAIQAGGNGFVGAFVGGLAFGSVTPADDAALTSFAHPTLRAASPSAPPVAPLLFGGD